MTAIDFDDRARVWLENNRHRLGLNEAHAIKSLGILLRHIHEVGRQDGLRCPKHPSSGRISVSEEVNKILEGKR